MLPARLARRTSPTNIGMSLLSALAAHDFGYLPTDRLVARLDAALRAIESLERFQGHLLNWYNTVTRAPLHPRYVSTVDSGNLAGALLTLAQGLLDLESHPRPWASGSRDWRIPLQSCERSGLRRRDRKPSGRGDNQRPRARHHRSGRRGGFRPPCGHAPGIRATSGGVDRGDRSPGAGRQSRRRRLLGHAVLDALNDLGRDSAVAPASLHALAARMRTFVDEMRFDFLYDRRRRIFAIGYRLADAEAQAALIASSTICWRPRRGWPASSPSPKAMSRSSNRTTWDGW